MGRAVDGAAQGLRACQKMIPWTLERLGVRDRLYTALLCAAEVEIQVSAPDCDLQCHQCSVYLTRTIRQVYIINYCHEVYCFLAFWHPSHDTRTR